MGRIPDSILREHPSFAAAVAADVRVTLRLRGDGDAAPSRVRVAYQAVRLSVVSDSFAAQICYRAKASLQRHHVPVVPHLLHRLAMMLGQVCIGDPVIVDPGLYLPHGQVVVDGFTRIKSGVILFPWTTVGLVSGNFQGPVINRDVSVGTGAKVLGPVMVGKSAVIGANSVVLDNVPSGATVVGAPARVVSRATRRRRPSATPATDAPRTPPSLP